MDYVDYWVEKYKEKRHLYEDLTKRLQNLLEDVCTKKEIKALFESRTKDIESFKKKISKEDKSYNNPLEDITDLSGSRIILFSLSDVDKVVNLIANEFTIDYKRSIDKSKQLEPDRFGYLSQHYIVKTHENRKNLSEWSSVSELWAEIQVRTTLQHAWATVEHLAVYKNEKDVPKKLRRRFSRLSALFELADEELDSLLKERIGQISEYETEIAQGSKEIEINVDSLKTFIINSKENKFWVRFLRNDVGININDNDWGDLSRDVRFAQFFKIKTINEIDKILKDAHGWGEQFFLDYFENMTKELKVSKDKINMVTNGVLTTLIIASNFGKITPKILDTEFGYGDAKSLLYFAKKSQNQIQ